MKPSVDAFAVMMGAAARGGSTNCNGTNKHRGGGGGRGRGRASRIFPITTSSSGVKLPPSLGGGAYLAATPTTTAAAHEDAYARRDRGDDEVSLPLRRPHHPDEGCDSPLQNPNANATATTSSAATTATAAACSSTDAATTTTSVAEMTTETTTTTVSDKLNCDTHKDCDLVKTSELQPGDGIVGDPSSSSKTSAECGTNSVSPSDSSSLKISLPSASLSLPIATPTSPDSAANSCVVPAAKDAFSVLFANSRNASAVGTGKRRKLSGSGVPRTEVFSLTLDATKCEWSWSWTASKPDTQPSQSLILPSASTTSPPLLPTSPLKGSSCSLPSTSSSDPPSASSIPHGDWIYVPCCHHKNSVCEISTECLEKRLDSSSVKTLASFEEASKSFTTAASLMQEKKSSSQILSCTSQSLSSTQTPPTGTHPYWTRANVNGRWSAVCNYVDPVDGCTVSVALETNHTAAKPINLNDDALRCNMSRPNRRPLNLPRSILKSLLQKNVRLCRPDAAVRAALALMKLDFVHFIRRLSIIVVEDAIAHPLLPFVVWLTLAVSAQGACFNLTKCHVETCLWIVSELATINIKDPFPGYHQAPLTTSELQRLPCHQQSFVKSLFVRAAFGGMKGDVKMLKLFGNLWTRRFLQDIPSPLWCGTEFCCWESFICGMYSRHATRAIALETVGPLSESDIPLSCVDFHCCSIDTLLSNQVVIDSITNFVKENTGENSVHPEDMLLLIKRVMWHFRSSTNFKKPVIEIQQSDIEAAHTTSSAINTLSDQRLTPLWESLKDQFDAFSYQTIQKVRYNNPDTKSWSQSTGF
ncbi:hypothetical protein Pelo_4690 [Pelomyxa schiedti]|nr:hypothetical protein Pelo_4690 [Pelomyxa schiedti]